MVDLTLSEVHVELPIFEAHSKRLLSKDLFNFRSKKSGPRVSNKVIVPALRDISLKLIEGDRLGLIGHNGAGKTTLLRVMAGVYEPTRGEIAINGLVSPMFDIGLGMIQDATGVENARMIGALLGMNSDEIDEALKDIGEFTDLGDYLNLPVRTYSAGMQTRLAFGIATLQSPEIILLDEGLATGDAAFANKASHRLRKFFSNSRIMVVASHSEQIIRRMCNKVALMHKGEITFVGDVDEGYDRYMDSVVDNSLSSVGANLKLSDDVSSEKDIDATKAQSPKSQNRMQANKSINVSVLWEHKSFGGTQGVYEHTSVLCNCTMRFSLYLPPQAKEGPVPVVIWLGGQGNGCDYLITHCGPQELCAKYGVALAAPDVSPSIGQGIPDSPMERDFGIGAGFFIDATEEPWAGHYQMFSYVSEEFPKFIARHFNVDSKKQGLFGHDMGGHGALVIGLRNPEKFKSLSAFAPYCSLSQSPVGKKALEGYLGTVNSENTWRNYDAVNLIEDGHLFPGEILVEQGTDDRYLSSQLKPELFEDACKRQGQEYTINFREGYDHSSFFIRSFFDLHLEHHVRALSLKKELDEIGLIKNIGDTGDQFN